MTEIEKVYMILDNICISQWDVAMHISTTKGGLYESPVGPI